LKGKWQNKGEGTIGITKQCLTFLKFKELYKWEIFASNKWTKEEIGHKQ
jgi:hypothetical protein